MSRLSRTFFCFLGAIFFAGIYFRETDISHQTSERAALHWQKGVVAEPSEISANGVMACEEIIRGHHPYTTFAHGVEKYPKFADKP